MVRAGEVTRIGRGRYGPPITSQPAKAATREAGPDSTRGVTERECQAGHDDDDHGDDLGDGAFD
jgi:hypothetical protein